MQSAGCRALWPTPAVPPRRGRCPHIPWRLMRAVGRGAASAWAFTMRREALRIAAAVSDKAGVSVDLLPVAQLPDGRGGRLSLAYASPRCRRNSWPMLQTSPRPGMDRVTPMYIPTRRNERPSRRARTIRSRRRTDSRTIPTTPRIRTRPSSGSAASSDRDCLSP
jgi:hypothetical protein